MHTFDPWPWQVVGPLIAGVMSSLLLIGKRFGLSSNLRTMCSIAGANRFSDYFKMDWKSQSWNLVFVLGTIAGGAVARFALLKPGPVIINPKTALRLRAWGIDDAGTSFAPDILFGPEAWSNPAALAFLLIGGVLVGFGTRWANGCTSGHAISGLSAFQWPSLIAVAGFLLGGLIVAHLILPLLIPLL